MSFAQVLARAAAVGSVDIARAPKDGRASRAYLSPETKAPVIQWLDQHEPFRAVSGQVLHRSTGFESVESSSAAAYLTERAIDHGPEAVAASFERVMMGAPVTHATVVVVKGVSVTSVVEVAPGVTVEPIAGLFNVSERAHAFDVGAQFHRYRSEPTAIVLRVRAAPTYSPRLVDPERVPQTALTFPPIQPALDAISLVAGAAVVPDISYCVVEEAGWPTMISGGIGGSYAVERIVELMPAQAPALHEVSQLLNSHSRGDSLTRAIRS